MPFRIFVTVSFLLIVAAGTGFLALGGWSPWVVAAGVVALLGVAFGFIHRRRRGPQTPLAVRPERRAVEAGIVPDEIVPPAPPSVIPGRRSRAQNR